MTESYLARYQAGQHEQVWAELVALGAAVREEPVHSDARAVAQEIMRRVGHNIALIVQRLRALDYQFVSDLPRQEVNVARIVTDILLRARQQLGDRVPASMGDPLQHIHGDLLRHVSAMAEGMQHRAEQWRIDHAIPEPTPSTTDPVWRMPDDALREQVAELQQRYGPLPLVLDEWFTRVGEVDLCGVHPKLSCYVNRGPDDRQGPASDPLVVACITSADDLDDYAAEMQELPPYTLEIAPDACHKSNYSGGSPTGVHIPNPDFDAPLISDDEWNGMYFVPYLRICFEHGGLPGLRSNPQAKAQAEHELAVLTKDLLPF
jgi:hypothetical protein